MNSKIKGGLLKKTIACVKKHSTGLSVVAVLSVTAAFMAGCQSDQSGQASAEASGSNPVERGKYLVTIAVCNDCHTPWKMGANGPEPDMTRMLSGHPEDLKMPPLKMEPGPWAWAGAATNTAFAGPWGVSFAANLTPDSLTGLGNWPEEMFINTLRTGKHMGDPNSYTLRPPMPWPWFSQMTDEDLRAVYAYLRTIPPIRNQVPTAPAQAAAN